MKDEVALTLWCNLAFRPNLNKDEYELLDKCAYHLLKLIGNKDV